MRKDDTELVIEEADPVPTPARPVKPTGKRKVKGHKGKAVKAKPANGHAKAAKATPRKARQRDPLKLDDYGLRLDSMKSQAAHMYARKSGATLAEVKAKVGSVQFNVLTELKSRGYKVRKVDEAGTNGRTTSRYFVQPK